MLKQAPRQITTCVCCGQEGPHLARGLIRPCYLRHRRLGTLDQYGRVRQPAEVAGRIDGCVCCGAEGPIKGRGLIYPCYQRHRWAGTLDQFPLAGPLKASIRRAQQARADAHAARVEDYVFLRASGTSPENALGRVGLKVSVSNIRRYESLAGVS